MPLTRAALLFALTLAAASLTAHAQTMPTLQVYSRETIVDVLVTDKDGHPVHNLKPSDFTVTEDGKPQPIRSFLETSKDIPLSTEASVSLRKLPPNTYTNLQSASATGPLDIFLFDNINDGGNSFVVHKEDIPDLLKRLPAGTQVAVMGLASRLTVIQSPTSDPSLLPKGLTTVLDPYVVIGDSCTVLREHIYATLRQLNQIADYLSGLKGRKNLIWIGRQPSFLVFPNGCVDATQDIRLTYDHLAEAQVAIDPLDPHGLAAPIVTPGGPITGNTGAQVATATMGVQMDIATDHLTMEAIAEATGGLAFYNNNDRIGLIVQAIDNGSSYYTLSYAPRIAAYDGKLHSIHITVSKPGVHLVYRTAYSAENTQSASADSATSKQMPTAMAQGAPPATQLLFDVRIQPSIAPPDPFDPPILGALNPKLKSQHLTRYELLYAVPASQIAFTQATDGTYTGSLEFDVAAYDIDGCLVTLRSQTMRLPLTTDEYQQFLQTPFKFFQQLDLPPGQLFLRTGVKDAVSNKLGTLEVPITPAKNMPPPEAGQ